MRHDFLALLAAVGMIINESAGSGGDAMPWYFRRAGIGKLVGTRTWGGLVGIRNYPPLLDGGRVSAPRGAIYGLQGQWEVENVGITPAVEVALEDLSKTPLPTHARPAFPNYHKTGGTPAAPAGDRP